MKLLKKCSALALALALGLSLAACSNAPASAHSATSPAVSSASGAAGARLLTDGAWRQVELPETVERVVCVGVGALRYTCYMGAADRVVGVEDYENEPSLTRLYSYVNGEKFKDLPVIGTNGSPSAEEIIAVDPQVIVMSEYARRMPTIWPPAPASRWWWCPAATPPWTKRPTRRCGCWANCTAWRAGPRS